MIIARIQAVHHLSRRISEDMIRFEIDFRIVVNPPQHPDLAITELFEDEIKYQARDRTALVGEWIRFGGDLPSGDGTDRAHAACRLQGRAFRGGTERVYPLLKRIVVLTAVALGLGLLPTSVAVSHPFGTLVPIPGSPSHRDVI